MLKCDRCIHNDVCQFKSEYIALLEKTQGILPGEEMLAKGKKCPFRLDIECSHHRPQTNILQEAWLKSGGGRAVPYKIG